MVSTSNPIDSIRFLTAFQGHICQKTVPQFLRTCINWDCFRSWNQQECSKRILYYASIQVCYWLEAKSTYSKNAGGAEGCDGLLSDHIKVSKAPKKCQSVP
jgi:hypothetical protein